MFNGTKIFLFAFLSLSVWVVSLSFSGGLLAQNFEINMKLTGDPKHPQLVPQTIKLPQNSWVTLNLTNDHPHSCTLFIKQFKEGIKIQSIKGAPSVGPNTLTLAPKGQCEWTFYTQKEGKYVVFETHQKDPNLHNQFIIEKSSVYSEPAKHSIPHG